jgi:DUF1680 family protein
MAASAAPPDPIGIRGERAPSASLALLHLLGISIMLRFLPFIRPAESFPAASLLIAAFCCLTMSSHPAESHAEPIKNAVPFEATPLPLTAVSLTGGPLKLAQDLNAKYLLELEPDRMLAGYRVRAGLEPKAEGYGGWDDVRGRQLTGHIAGHYLSAVSLMYAATGNEEFKRRADYIVSELKEVQDKHGDGYLGALLGTRPGAPRREGEPREEDLADGRELFDRLSKGEIRSGGFDLNGMWSPWYTLHKTYAGLRDAYRFTGNKTALELEVRFSEWAERVLAPLNDEQIQQMLNTEFGGMNEIFVDLYADTGDKRWLDLSFKFEHHDVVDPLQAGQDNLAGKHGNTQVPKLIGSLDRFITSGDAKDLNAARFFWDRVVEHHTFATGGHGRDEYFGQADRLSDFTSGRTAETCNVYNMLKLTRTLFALKPDPRYAEFAERALFNHILGSIDPNDGSTCYMVPVGQGVMREYADMFRSFTCCVGSGMESHALHGDGVYYETPDQLWVTLYVPSTARWDAADADVAMETDFPLGDSASFTLKLEKPRELTVSFRRPSWAGQGFEIQVNGEPVIAAAAPGSFVDVKRTWKSGDRVTLTLPKTLHSEPLPDNSRRIAVMWGPLVLAGDLAGGNPNENGDDDDNQGQRRRRRRGGRGAGDPPSFLAADMPVDKWLARTSTGDEPPRFRSQEVGRSRDIEFVPFYLLHRRSYMAYVDLFTPPEWEQRSKELAAERARQRRLEIATVAFAQPGEMQPERDFQYQGDRARPLRTEGRAGRVGEGWFSFSLPVESGEPMTLVATYYSGDWRQRTKSEFAILVDDKPLAEVKLEPSSPNRFYDVEYPIPADLTADKERITVRFEAKPDRQAGPVFGVRLIRGQLGGTPDDDESASVTKPPEAFFAIVDERARSAAREFYAKYLEVDGMPIVASKEIADEALHRTRDIVKHMLAGRPDVVEAMLDRKMYLIIIGKDQLYCDMPEYSDNPNPTYQNERVRGTGGRPTSFGEENLLSLPIDRYDDESIAVHEFCHTIDGALGTVDPTWRRRLRAAYDNAVEKGLYNLAYAQSNAGEYWAEIGQAYFDCNRVNNWNHGPIGTREQLKEYDPVGYELARSIFQLSPEQEWRYTFLQQHPIVIAPPEKFAIDPYYTKFSWAREFPVVGRGASDEALLTANKLVRKMFAYRHDILKALIADGAKLVVLGPGESLADLPETKGAKVDLLARTLDYSPETKLIVIPQENVLADASAPMIGGSQVVRGFAKAFYTVTAHRPVDENWDKRGRAVQQYELRVERLDERFGKRLDELFASAGAAGRWKGTAAGNSVADYWASGVLAYFDAAGQDAAPADAPHPITTREQLASYDAELFELVAETMAYRGHVDWRYE